MDRAALDAAIAEIDAFSTREGFPVEAWKVVRGECRRRRQQSERAVPAVANAAQHFAAARRELDNGLDALVHVAQSPPEDGT